jgi:hypothetical protein
MGELLILANIFDIGLTSHAFEEIIILEFKVGKLHFVVIGFLFLGRRRKWIFKKVFLNGERFLEDCRWLIFDTYNIGFRNL